MIPRSILITGANRGLGLELVKQLVALKPAPELVIATCRSPETATDLGLLAKTNKNVKVVQLDVEDEPTIEAAYKSTQSLVGAEGLNVIINNAGMNYRRKSLHDVTSAEMMRTYKVNVVGPTLICKTFLPLLKTSASVTNASKDNMSWRQSAVINISSIMGSVTKNTNGVLPQYKASKAALNQVMKCLSIELGQFGILVTNLHPGWVRTDMGGNQADVGKKESVEGMLDVIQKLDHNYAGLLYDYTGNFIQY